MAVQPCLVALRERYGPASVTDQIIFYSICEEPNNNEDTALDELRCLLNYGEVDINLRNEDGDTGLMLAVVYANTEIIEILCEKGADVMLTDNEGKTAFDIAEEEDLYDEEHQEENEEGNLGRRDRIIEVLTTYMLAASAGVPVAAAAPVNARPAINEKMDQMPNAWKESNLDDMTCPVCKGLYYKPLTFSCGHSLCKPCFGMLPGGIMKKCPECREKIGGEKPKINIVIQKRCDKLRQLAEKHISNSNYKYNNSFGFDSPRAGTKGGKKTVKQRRSNKTKRNKNRRNKNRRNKTTRR
jgi:hypothetical protein